MPIQTPHPHLSQSDKRLILLLERLLAETERDGVRSNLDAGAVALTDAEAEELVSRIDRTLESKAFWQAAHLVELIARGDRDKAREVYLDGRARTGASRIMASSQYHAFLVRMGFERSYLPQLREMEFEYFVRMEKMLFLQLGIQPAIVDRLERFLWLQAGEVEAARQGKRPIPDGDLVRAVKSIRPSRPEHDTMGNLFWSANRVSGALVLFANMTVMFTTRDWSVTGTMSTMAGAVGLTAAG